MVRKKKIKCSYCAKIIKQKERRIFRKNAPAVYDGVFLTKARNRFRGMRNKKEGPNSPSSDCTLNRSGVFPIKDVCLTIPIVLTLRIK